MIVVLTLTNDVVSYDAEHNRIFIRPEFSGNYRGIFSVGIVSDANTICEAENKYSDKIQTYVINHNTKRITEDKSWRL